MLTSSITDERGGNMLNEYKSLEIEVLSFDEDDVIVTSGCETHSCPTEGEPIHCTEYF